MCLLCSHPKACLPPQDPSVDTSTQMFYGFGGNPFLARQVDRGYIPLFGQKGGGYIPLSGRKGWGVHTPFWPKRWGYIPLSGQKGRGYVPVSGQKGRGDIPLSGQKVGGHVPLSGQKGRGVYTRLKVGAIYPFFSTNNCLIIYDRW